MIVHAGYEWVCHQGRRCGLCPNYLTNFLKCLVDSYFLTWLHSLHYDKNWSTKSHIAKHSQIFEATQNVHRHGINMCTHKHKRRRFIRDLLRTKQRTELECISYSDIQQQNSYAVNHRCIQMAQAAQAPPPRPV